MLDTERETFVLTIEGYRDWDRLTRLAKIAQYMDGLHCSIERLHDHKGTLTVTWAEMPCNADMRRIESLWAVIGLELEENVEHRYMGATL